MTAPRATARLQFHGGFTLDDFAALGISHVYASPRLTCRAGSRHGDDTVDTGTLDPEVSGEAAQRLAVLSEVPREWSLGLEALIESAAPHPPAGRAGAADRPVDRGAPAGQGLRRRCAGAPEPSSRGRAGGRTGTGSRSLSVPHM